MTPAAHKRKAIVLLLSEARGPMLANEIADALGISTASAASNLAYLRMAKEVVKKRVWTHRAIPVHGFYFRQNEVFWTTAARKSELRHQEPRRPGYAPRRRPRPRTDDMKTMLEDIQCFRTPPLSTNRGI